MNATTTQAVNSLNFDTGIWLSVVLLIVLAVVFRLTSLFFLWLLRSRLQ